MNYILMFEPTLFKHAKVSLAGWTKLTIIFHTSLLQYSHKKNLWIFIKFNESLTKVYTTSLFTEKIFEQGCKIPFSAFLVVLSRQGKGECPTHFLDALAMPCNWYHVLGFFYLPLFNKSWRFQQEPLPSWLWYSTVRLTLSSLGGPFKNSLCFVNIYEQFKKIMKMLFYKVEKIWLFKIKIFDF